MTILIKQVSLLSLYSEGPLTSQECDELCITELQQVHVFSSLSQVRVLHVSSRVRALLGRTRVRVQQVSSPSPGVCCSRPNPSPK